MKRKIIRPFQLEMKVWIRGSKQNQAEHEWLSKSSQLIKQAYPVQSDDELGKAKLGLMLIALGLIYLDFCYRAWDIGSEPLYECEPWANSVGIDKKTLIKLAKAANVKLTVKDFNEDKDLFAETVLEFANEVRTKVFDLLCPNLYQYPEIIKELCEINDSSEFSNILDKVDSWFSDKCSYPLQ